MTRVDLAKIAYRLLAMFFFLRALAQAPSLLGLFYAGRADDQMMSVALSVLIGISILALLSVGAFLAADKLARWTFRDEDISLPAWDAGAVMQTGLALLGAWALARSLPTLARLVLPLFFGGDDGRYHYVLGELPSAITQLLIGLLLFVQARGLSRLWTALQEFGLKPDLNEPPPPQAP